MKKNYDELINLIKKAQGDKTLNQFALSCQVNAGHLSRLLNGNFVNPPSPETLKKISKGSHGIVTYEELLKACNYIEDEDLSRIDKYINDNELYDKFNHLVKNENAKVLFDKLGDLNEDELKQFVDIVTIIKKDDKNNEKNN